MTQFRRKILYLGGFDPRGVRFYYQLLKDQLERYTALTGHAVTVSPRRNATKLRTDWTVRNETADVTTDYSFLRWEDIVRNNWIHSPTRLALRATRTYWNYLRHLDFRMALRIGSPVVRTKLPSVECLLA